MTKKSKEKINPDTGEITITEEFNKVIIHESIRKNGSLRIQQDFSNCPTLAEQHTAHLTNINYLIERYKPDELQAYITARNQFRTEIINHDFSLEPDLQGAKNIVYESRSEFDKLNPIIKNQFRNHVEFLKFIDNPANAEKMVRLGVLTPIQLQKLLVSDNPIVLRKPEPTPKPTSPTPTPKP